MFGGRTMNDNVKKIFKMLGVEPYEVFKIKDFSDAEFFKISEGLSVYHKVNSSWGRSQVELGSLLTGENEIVKPLPKKKKLRFWTMDDFKKWEDVNCKVDGCDDCPFANVFCNPNVAKSFWMNHKDLYSDKFLDQEVEVPEE